MNPREDNVWIPDDTYYCKLIGRLVDNILYWSHSKQISYCTTLFIDLFIVIYIKSLLIAGCELL